jgi:hypothetical protein
MDLWTQRLVAVALVIASVALLVGASTYAYKEVASLQPAAAPPAKKK